MLALMRFLVRMCAYVDQHFVPVGKTRKLIDKEKKHIFYKKTNLGAFNVAMQRFNTKIFPDTDNQMCEQLLSNSTTLSGNFPQEST